MKKLGLVTKDRMGIFYGTIFFFFTLPLAVFIAAVPGVMVSNWFQMPVAVTSVRLAFFASAAVLAFIQSMIVGLMFSYFVSWGSNKIHLTQTIQSAIAHAKGEVLQIEEKKLSNYGAAAGALCALIVFLMHGNIPIRSLTTKVEHLFPEPLVMSLGSFFSLNLSHLYAVATGYLAVGFLFAVVGIVTGTLVNAVAELTLKTFKPHA